MKDWDLIVRHQMAMTKPPFAIVRNADCWSVGEIVAELAETQPDEAVELRRALMGEWSQGGTES